MKLIVGLGNPGGQYEKTRHNVGFNVLDALARRRHLEFSPGQGDSWTAKLREQWGQTVAVLAKPSTSVNLSGRAVVALKGFYKIEIPDLLIVTDDVNLPLGRLRARVRGSEGGHNGLRSIIEQLGTNDFPRLRVGVGRGDSQRDLADHVLARFEPDEYADIERAIERAADAAEVFVTDGIVKVMNTFNPGQQAASEPEAG